MITFLLKLRIKNHFYQISGNDITGQDKLLIVEDEGVTALEIQCKVEEWGYSVVGVVSSGKKQLKQR